MTSVKPVPAGRRDSLEQIRSGEAGDERIARRADELLRGSELEHAAVDEHPDPIGERRCVLEVVGDEQRRHSQLSEELVQLRAHGAPRMTCREPTAARREAGRRARRASARASATRWRSPPESSVGTRGREAVDAKALEQLGNGSPIARAEGDVSAHVEVRKERVLLEDEPDPAPLGRHVDAACTVEPRLAAET